MDERTPGQDFHSQAIPPALLLTAFTALPAAQPQPFCTPPPPAQQIGNTVNPPVKGQSSSVRTFLQRPTGKHRG